jgi:hypothetical protein
VTCQRLSIPGQTFGEHYCTEGTAGTGEPAPTLYGSTHSGCALAETAGSDCRRRLTPCDEPCCPYRNTITMRRSATRQRQHEHAGIGTATLLISLLSLKPLTVAVEDTANRNLYPLEGLLKGVRYSKADLAK